MLLQVIHRTTFAYAGPVRDSFNEVRLHPVDDDRQTCRRFRLRVDPAINDVREYSDYYGNRVNYFDIAAPHEQLVIEAESEVETKPTRALDEIPRVPTPVHGGPNEHTELFAEYLGESHYAPLSVELQHEAREAFAAKPRSDIWTDAQHLGRHVFNTFKYQPNTTGVNTRASDALALRAGVCQDYAHVMLALCRVTGIPARYTSGYFLNDQLRLGEIEASHAWVEVMVPGFGWIGYDPTHDRIADERYVKIAAGRDYADIRPVSGTYRGPGTRELRVEVFVRPAIMS
jgi:transglutaminase-like putative cysteine protease